MARPRGKQTRRAPEGVEGSARIAGAFQRASAAGAGGQGKGARDFKSWGHPESTLNRCLTNHLARASRPYIIRHAQPPNKKKKGSINLCLVRARGFVRFRSLVPFKALACTDKRAIHLPRLLQSNAIWRRYAGV